MRQIATVFPATRQRIIDQFLSNRLQRGEWKWVRFANGRLMLGFFPIGDGHDVVAEAVTNDLDHAVEHTNLTVLAADDDETEFEPPEVIVYEPVPLCPGHPVPFGNGVLDAYCDGTCAAEDTPQWGYACPHDGCAGDQFYEVDRAERWNPMDPFEDDDLGFWVSEGNDGDGYSTVGHLCRTCNQRVTLPEWVPTEWS